MTVDTLEIVKFIWEVVSGIAVAAWIVVPVLLQTRTPWTRYLDLWRVMFWKSERRSTKRDLIRLIRTLGEMQRWLSHEDVPVWQSLRRRLWALTVQLSINESAFFAMHSDDASERKTAVLHLSQADDVVEATKLVRGIIADKSCPEEVRRAATRALQVLKVRKDCLSESKAKFAN